MPLPNRAKVSLSHKRAQTLQSQQLQQPKSVEASKITLKKASSSVKQLTRQQENIMRENNPQTVVENHNNDASFSNYTYSENNDFSSVADDYSQLDYSEPNFDSISQEPNTTANNSVVDPVLDYNNSGDNDTTIFDDNTSEQATISPFAINTDYSSIDSNKYANSSSVNEQVSTPNGDAENVEIPPISDYDNGSMVEADNGGVYDNANNASENELDDNNDAENKLENIEERSDENTIDTTDTANTTDNADDTDESDAENETNSSKKAFRFMNLKALIAQAKNEIGGKSSENDENASNSSKTGKNAGKNAGSAPANMLKNGEMLENGGNSLDEQDSPVENGGNAEDSEKPNSSKNAENSGKTGKNGGNAGNNPVLKILKPIIALPLGAVRLVLRVLSVCFHGVYAIISSLGTILVLWAVCNIPSMILNTSADFDQDEGTTTVSNIKYDSKTGRIDAKITNSSDMIAHVDVGGELVSWQPFAKLPFSLFLPQRTGQCSNITISQINPDETRNITIQCSNAQGIWVRPKAVMKGI